MYIIPVSFPVRFGRRLRNFSKFALFVKRLVSDHVFNIDIIQFHTDNIVGMKNMYMYLRSAKVAGVIPETTNIIKRKVVCIDGNEHFASYDVIQ